MASLIDQITSTVDLNNQDDDAFTPYAYYGEEEDALTFYFRGDSDYARRINSRVTVFLALESDELVGCQIKSVQHVLNDIGWFDVNISHGRIKLALLFVACRGEFDEDAKPLYRQIGACVSEANLEVNVPLLESPA